jgi:hypothetical protein
MAFCVGGLVWLRSNPICIIDAMGADNRWAHRRGSSSIRGVVSGCIAAVAAVKVGVRSWSSCRFLEFVSLEIDKAHTYGDLCKQNKIHDKNLATFFRKFLVFEKYLLCLFRVTLFFLD